MDIMGIVWEVVDLIPLGQNRDQWKALVNMITFGFHKWGISYLAE